MATSTTTALEEPVTSITSTIQEPEKATYRDRNRTYLPNGNSDNETSTVHSLASSISTAPTMIGSLHVGDGKYLCNGYQSNVFCTQVDQDKSSSDDVYSNSTDGGYGWFVVFGSFLAYLTSFGLESCW